MKSQRSLTTILFTDIVGSTERATELGDRAWRELQERHHRVVREELRRWGGREVTEAGDGFLALFDNPARAIVCAHRVRERARELGLDIRCGIHMGQVERGPDGSAGGIAVHIGARTAGKAPSGEIVVTSSVRDAESGSGFVFEDLGHHDLKGVDRPWLLFRVTALPGDAASIAPEGWERLRRSVGPKRAAAIAGLVIVALVGGYAVTRSNGPPEVLASGIRSLAVLPLENLTGDPEQEYFVDGMTEALITELSKIGAVRVISRTSAMRYRGTEKSLPEIAGELGVDGVVEGSVTRVGDRVRISAQLIHAGTDTHVWAESYDGDVADVLRLQSEVARAIAREIEVVLSPEAEARLAAADSVDPETYEAYLRGMFYLSKATPADVQRGLAYLHQAVEKNPGDARAYAGLALGYATLGHGFDPPPDAWPKARAAAERAVRLDPELAEAHQALADVKMYYEWDWEGAGRAFRRANELNPNLAMNRYHYAWYLVQFGRFDEAIVEHELAKELDPLTSSHTAWLGELYRRAGRNDDALAAAQEALAMDPDSPIARLVLGRVYLDKGMEAEAIATHEEMAAKFSPARWYLGLTYVQAGRRDQARRILAGVESQEVTPWNALGRAYLHAALGDRDEAFRWLAHEPHHAFLMGVRSHPVFEPLHDDPRFLALMDRMNLPPPEL